jgi:hypothetical protein
LRDEPATWLQADEEAVMTTPNRRAPAIDAARREEARRLFETSEIAQVGIAARAGILPASLTRMAKREGWIRFEKGKRAQTVRRIRARVEREIEAVEQVLEKAGALGEADGAARTLGSLVRTLRELQKYDEDAARRSHLKAEDEDVAPADLDALRDALADRLEKLRREND